MHLMPRFGRRLSQAPRRSSQAFRSLFALATLLALGLSLAALPGAARAQDPEQFPVFDLVNSALVASPASIASGQETTVTVILRNDGDTADTVEVTVVHPDSLAYVTGSGSSGASYSSGDRAVSWPGVSVPGGGEARHTFRLRSRTAVDASRSETLVAAIAGVNERILRFATVTLVPGGGDPGPDPSPPPGKPRLDASFKAPSRLVASPGDTIAYTISLYNNGTADADVTVSDPLPAELRYVEGSASNGASYNSTSRTLRWEGITVGVGRRVELTFRAQPDGASSTPRTVVNTARIEFNNTSISRSAAVLLSPETPAPGRDAVPPIVRSLTIDTQDLLTNRSTSVRVAASDNEGVTEIYLREWQLVTAEGWTRWEVVQSSGWRTFTPDAAIPWELGSQSGTHYIGAWVRDAAGNVSLLTPLAIDFVSLLNGPTSVAAGRAVIYQVYYSAGTEVSASLSRLSGDPDLYVWFPSSPLLPDARSIADGAADEALSFTAPRSGMYVFAVVGYTAAEFTLAISPAGGPAIPLAVLDGAPETTLRTAANLADGKAQPTIAELLNSTGLDPLGSPSATSPDFIPRAFLPAVMR